MIALGSAGVLTVYGVGFLRTQEAAARLDSMADRPRIVIPDAPVAGVPSLAEAESDASSVPVIQVVSRTSPDPAVAGASPVASVPVEVEPSPAPETPSPAPRTAPEATPISAADLPAPASSAAAPVAGAEGTSKAPAPAEPPPVLAGGAVEDPPVSPEEAPDPPLPPSTTAPAGAASPVEPPPADPPSEPPATAGEAGVAEPPVPEPPPAPQWKDGTYYGWGSSRHGSIQAAVTITNGRIVSASIAQCRTRYSCSWISKLPPQVVDRQSPETDFISGATQSTNAFYYGVVEALSKAK